MKTLAAAAVLAIAGLSFAPQETAGNRSHALASRQDRFMAAVKNGEFEKAYEDLIKGSRFENKDGQLKAFASETEKAVKPLGEIRDWDSHGILWQDNHQAFGSAILCGEERPIYFYFAWYRKTQHARWVLLHVWVGEETKDYWELRQ